MMFAQANSEHCRHKIFNASWVLDGVAQQRSLFAMIRHTHASHPQGTVVAYSDNSAVIEGATAARFHADAAGRYGAHVGPTHILMKVETHNHPTAIAPFPGAATGSGGEIRDEGATGIGAKPKAGLTGFTVSHLRIPSLPQPWEAPYGKPDRIASALDIMLAGPIGGASFNNEFGRPNLCGYFRTFEQAVAGEVRGYHKPIMIAGGLGNIAAIHTHKRPLPDGALLIQLGGPGMLIGMGGGAASSMATGANAADLDFDSVQRGNAEMQRRAQEVIDRCWQLGEANPILSLHDVGAGGLSNALPELVHGGGAGGSFELRAVPSEEPGMAPREIWCNEAQERYVLAIAPGDLDRFRALCERERCPFAVVGRATADGQLVVTDAHFGNRPVDMALDVLLGKPPRMTREATHLPRQLPPLDLAGVTVADAALRVLQLPAVADKTFLVTIGDRTVGGLCARDPMVGPWQVPVADVAVTLMDFAGYAGEAMAMGERTPLALIDAPASGRMAVGEAITNIAAAGIGQLADVKLSANWMAAAGHPGEDALLYDTVRAVGMELCPALGVSIPVGKDSMSMRTTWRDPGDGGARAVTSPLSLIVSAFAPVADARRVLTPRLATDRGASVLCWIDLGAGRGAARRLGARAGVRPAGRRGARRRRSGAPARVLRHRAGAAARRPPARVPRHRRRRALRGARGNGVRVAVRPRRRARRHRQRSAGAAVRRGAGRGRPGARARSRRGHRADRGRRSRRPRDRRTDGGRTHPHRGRTASCSWTRRAPTCTAPGRRPRTRCSGCATTRRRRTRNTTASSTTAIPASRRGSRSRIDDDVAAPYIATGARPAIAILREQGVNGQVEMAAAFDRAGFAAHDVHMSDLLAGRRSLAEFRGFVACGGFSYGDVLGAGEGWAKSILFNARAREDFAAFFARGDTFALGVCNGCQMMSNLHELIPGTARWPHFVRNRSEQFEARLVAGRGPALAVAVLRRDGRQPHPRRAGARRGLRRVSRRRGPRRGAVLRDAALRRPCRRGHRALSLQSQRLAAGHHRPHHARTAAFRS